MTIVVTHKRKHDLDPNNDHSGTLSESNISFDTSTGHDHDGSNSKEVPILGKVLASGTLTVATTTNAYDVDFVDVPIGAGDLTANDIIYIEVAIMNVANKTLAVKVTMTDLTNADRDVLDILEVGTNLTARMLGRVWQAGEDSQFIIHNTETTLTNTFASNASKYDTGDANIFTTAFGLRVNIKYATQPADIATTVRYKIYVIKS